MKIKDLVFLLSLSTYFLFYSVIFGIAMYIEFQLGRWNRSTWNIETVERESGDVYLAYGSSYHILR